MEKQYKSSEPWGTLMVTLKKTHFVYQMSQMCERIIFTKFLLKLRDYEQLWILLAHPNWNINMIFVIS